MTVLQCNSSEQIMAGYQHLLEVSARLLLHSREQDWQALSETHAQYVALVGQLKKREQGVALSSAQLARKLALLQQLLIHDQEIQANLIARRDELGELLEVSQRQRKLNQAYGTTERR